MRCNWWSTCGRTLWGALGWTSGTRPGGTSSADHHSTAFIGWSRRRQGILRTKLTHHGVIAFMITRNRSAFRWSTSGHWAEQKQSWSKHSIFTPGPPFSYLATIPAWLSQTGPHIPGQPVRSTVHAGPGTSSSQARCPPRSSPDGFLHTGTSGQPKSGHRSRWHQWNPSVLTSDTSLPCSARDMGGGTRFKSGRWVQKHLDSGDALVQTRVLVLQSARGIGALKTTRWNARSRRG